MFSYIWKDLQIRKHLNKPDIFIIDATTIDMPTAYSPSVTWSKNRYFAREEAIKLKKDFLESVVLIKFFLPFALIIASLSSHAQVELLKDINHTIVQTSQTTIALDDPQDFIALGNKVIFRAYDNIHGWELWVTDNTHEGTYLLKDLSGTSSEPTSFTFLNGFVYFAAGTESNGRELWKTDGTTAGTVLVADINLGEGTGLRFPDFMTELNGELFFIADDGTGEALWKSDGTAQGTSKVKSMTFDTSSAGPFKFAKIGNTLFINAYDEEHGYELWRSDGTAAGTVIVKDLVPGTDFGFPRTMTRLNTDIFFVAFSPDEGKLNLWKSDGTTDGTSAIKTIDSETSAYPAELKSGAGLIFFTSDDGLTGRELWRTDGTPTGTFMINKKSSWDRVATSPVDVNGTVYFVSNSGNGNELWKTDGTVAGTVLVKDIHNGSSSSSPAGLTAVEDLLYFVANDGINGEALWQSDGTEQGTKLEKVIGANSGIKNITNINESIYFHADDGIGSNTRLWSYDPVEKKATNLGYRFTYSTDFSASSDPGDFIRVNETIYFRADDGIHGFELWKSDGTSSGTSLVKDITPGVGDSYFYELTPANGQLFFTVDNGIHGKEIWKTDGTTEGTVIVKDIEPGLGTSYPQYLVFHNGEVYFSAQAGIDGAELWKTDGTETGTVMVKDIYPGDWSSSAPYNLTSVGNTLYFVAYDDIHFTGLGIWKSDGTAGGTVIVNSADSQIGAVDYPWMDNKYLKNINGTLYFKAYTPDVGHELWKSDGTAEGTVLVKDINPGPASSTIEQLTEFNGILYFTANDGVRGDELWKTDGTEEGTMLVKDIYAGSNASYPWDLTTANNLLFFTATNEQGDFYFWRTDGTAAGTFAIESNDPNGSTKNPWNFIKDGDQIFFVSFDTSEHLWRTDGTLCGTVLLAREHIAGIAFSDLIFLNNKILFSGEVQGSEYGEELYAYHVEDVPPSRCQTISFDPIITKTYGDADFTLTASASSGLPVQFSSADPSIVSIEDNVVTILKSGSTTITASQPGNGSFNPASTVGQMLVIEKASLTVTADDQTIFYGDAIPTLTISYSGFKMLDDESTIDSQPIATTEATNGSSPGLYAVLLTGGTDENYTITLVPGTLVINKAKQTINLSISNNTLGGLPFTVSATATSELPVTLSTASEKINLSGQTITMLEAGNVTIYASQSGNEYFEAAPSVESNFCINPEKPILTISGNNTPTPIIESSSSSGNQWFLNSIAMTNDQSFLEVKEGGVYTVSVTHDNCTSELSDPVSMIVTGINDEFSDKVVLFPNPTPGKLHVKLKSLQNGVKKISIIDAKGITKDVIHIQDQLEEVEIDVSGYASGPYILLINSNDLVFSQKFIRR